MAPSSAPATAAPSASLRSLTFVHRFLDEVDPPHRHHPGVGEEEAVQALQQHFELLSRVDPQELLTAIRRVWWS